MVDILWPQANQISVIASSNNPVFNYCRYSCKHSEKFKTENCQIKVAYVTGKKTTKKHKVDDERTETAQSLYNIRFSNWLKDTRSRYTLS